MTRSRCLRAASGPLATFALLAFAPPARATVPVETEECPNLDPAEIERLLAIELSGVASAGERMGAPTVLFVCDEKNIRILVTDPVTSKRLERTIIAPPPRQPGRDRVAALAASQLFLASWLELLLPEPEHAAPVPAPTSNAAAEQLVRRALRPSRGWEVDLVGTVRARDLGTPYATFQPSVRPAWALDSHWRVFASLGFEGASAQRARGTIDVSAGSVGLGVGWRSARLGFVALSINALASAVYVRLAGNSASPNVLAASGSGLGAELALEAGPTFTFGPVRASLALQGGLTVPTIAGRVANEPGLDYGGGFVGAGLSVGFEGWR